MGSPRAMTASGNRDCISWPETAIASSFSRTYVDYSDIEESADFIGILLHIFDKGRDH